MPLPLTLEVYLAPHVTLEYYLTKMTPEQQASSLIYTIPGTPTSRDLIPIGTAQVVINADHRKAVDYALDQLRRERAQLLDQISDRLGDQLTTLKELKERLE